MSKETEIIRPDKIIKRFIPKIIVPKVPFDAGKLDTCKTVDDAEAYLKGTQASDLLQKHYLAIFALEKNYSADSIRLSEELIESIPDSAYGYAVLGFAQRLCGEFQKACANVTKAKSLKNDLFYTNGLLFAYHYMHVLYDVKAFDVQLVFLNEAEKAEKKDIELAEIHFLKCTVFVETNRFDEAWAEYYKGFKIDPHHKQAETVQRILNWRDPKLPTLKIVH